MIFRVFFSAFILCFAHAALAVPFLRNIQLSSFEVYEESMRVLVPGDDPTLVAAYRFTVDITAAIEEPAALLFDEDTPFNIRVGDFSFEGLLGQDAEFDSTVAGKNRSASFDFRVFDVNTEEFLYGKVTFNWSALTSLKVSVVFNTTSPEDGARFFDAFGQPDFTLWAYRNAISDAPNPDVIESDFAEISFGVYSQSPLTYFVHGSSTVNGDDSLIRVVLYGGTDSLVPSSTISNPQPGITEVVSSPIIIEGTVKDTYRVGLPGATKTYVNLNKPTVEYFIGALEQLPASPAWLAATVSTSQDDNGNWTWQTPGPVDLVPGFNYIFTRFTDDEGNVLEPVYRRLKFSTRGSITVTGTTTGFGGEHSGKTVGTVAGSGALFPRPKIISVIANGSPQPLSDTRQLIDAGSVGSVVAKPGPTAIFNGWTGKVDNVPIALDPAESGKEHYTFFSRLKLTLIGTFVPNPFLLGGAGTYFGITDGSSGDRGVFTGKLSKTGAFTGKFTLGKIALPVKGKFLGSGSFIGKVVRKGVTYNIALNVTVDPLLNRQITGTITGGGLNSSLVSDLSIWKSRVTEATAFVGDYNILLPATGTVPEGIGFGRVSISKIGKVKVAGKAGDGATFSFSSVLFKRSDTEVGFPFLATLENNTGSIAGQVNYNSALPDSDLTGTLDWYRPPNKKVEPSGISGEISLHGSRYTAPNRGALVMLSPSGAGVVTVSSPSFITPPAGASVLNIVATTLQPNHALGPVPDSATVQRTTLAFAATKGLFTGKFFDPVLKKTFSFAGAASQKANAGKGYAGGVLVRGNRTGRVELAAPAP